MVEGCKKKGRNLPFGLPIAVLFPHQQVIDGQGAEGVPFRLGITDMPMSATRSFLPPVVWMTRKKIFFYL